MPLGVSDGHGGYDHGPWDPADCSRQLLAWFDAGLVQLYADPPDDAPRPQNLREWRAWNDGRYRLVPVTLGRSEDNFTEVTLPEGVAATTTFVTDGAYSLLAKMKNAEEEE